MSAISMSAFTGWIDAPLCGFDLETDSVDPLDARIVTAHVGIYDPRNETAGWQGNDWVVKPERPIPDEAAAIHGYTTERAKHEGIPRRAAVGEIVGHLQAAWLAGASVVGQNISYDLTLLDAEMRRLGLGPLALGGMVIDTYVLAKQIDENARSFVKGRTYKLGDLCARYGVKLDDAHSSDADALAATRLAWKLVRHLPYRPNDHAASVEMAMAWQAEAYRNQRLGLAHYFRTKKGDERTATDIETHLEWPIWGRQVATQPELGAIA